MAYINGVQVGTVDLVGFILPVIALILVMTIVISLLKTLRG